MIGRKGIKAAWASIIFAFSMLPPLALIIGMVMLFLIIRDSIKDKGTCA